MAYVFKSAIRLLARHENISASMFRKCSSQELPPNSNKFFIPRISIKGNNSFGNRTTRPSPKVATCIMLQGKPNNFQDSEELIEGALFAIETVTQILSSKQDLENSDLVKHTTEQCFKHIISIGNPPEHKDFKKFDSEVVEEIFQKFIDPWLEKKIDEAIEHAIQTQNEARALIPKEDIFFSWIDNMNPEKNQMRIVTMSFPHLGEILNRAEQMDDQQEIVKYLQSLGLAADFNPKSIICCNWDFNKV